MPAGAFNNTWAIDATIKGHKSIAHLKSVPRIYRQKSGQYVLIQLLDLDFNMDSTYFIHGDFRQAVIADALLGRLATVVKTERQHLKEVCGELFEGEL
ncbi:MAG: hypothetical protein WCG27_09735 [Pseudomonadota bacterium]